MVLRKDQLEASLHEEKKLIKDGRLKEDNPLDFSESFKRFCEACRRGDLKVCQEMITEGANINARDSFDYTPLILVSKFPSAAHCVTILGCKPKNTVGSAFYHWAVRREANSTFDKASLCGHYEVVRLLLESGALCERDTFQGERYCL